MELTTPPSCIIPGLYKHDHDTDFEQYLVKIGTSYLRRKMMTGMRPTVRVAVTGGDTVSLAVELPFKTFQTTFKLGQEVEVAGPAGRKKHIFNVEDGRLVQASCDPSDTNRIERVFTETGLDMVFIHTPSGVRGTRHFKKEQE